MILRRYLLKLVVASLICAAAHSTPARATTQRTTNGAAATVVRAFFRYHLAHDMGFTRANIMRRQQWMTPELRRALMSEFSRMAAYSRTHPDEAPYINGDPFSDAQDTPRTFRVGAATGDSETARVPVTFIWNTGNRASDQTRCTVELRRIGGRWLINNIAYPSRNSDLLSDLSRARSQQ